MTRHALEGDPFLGDAADSVSGVTTALALLLVLPVLGSVQLGAEPAELHVFHGDGPSAQLGVAVAGAGDVDGDGFDDLIVGATDGIGNGDDPGRAFVYSGQDGSILFTFTGDFPGDAFGTAVDGAGDIDQNGHADLLVGARYSDHNGIFSGTVTVYSGEDGALLYMLHGDGEGDRLGYSVAGAGDVDGDGFPDVIAGAIFDSNNGFWSGSARVFSGLNGSILHHFDGDWSFDQLGTSVGGAGDVDGDGFDDLIVGVPENDDNGAAAGMARVFSGRSGAILYTFLGDAAGDRLGKSVDGAGDVDGDGFDDLVVGAMWDDDNGSSSGSVRVFSGLDGAVLYTFHGDSEGDELGYSVAGGGDVDGDGFDDLLAGAFLADVAGETVGSARLFSGRDGSVLHTFYGDSADDHFGVAVGAAGDVDADGYPDLIVGANHDDVEGTDSGSAYVLSASLVLQVPDPGAGGVTNEFRLTRATAGGRVAVLMGRGTGSTGTEIPGCGTVVFDLLGPLRFIGLDSADETGEATVSRFLPEGITGRTLSFQAIDTTSCNKSNLVVHTF